LKAALRLIFLKENEFNILKGYLEAEIIDLEIDLQVIQFLIKLINQYNNRFSTTLEEDDILLSSKNLPNRQLLALHLRVIERTIMVSILNLLKRQEKELSALQLMCLPEKWSSEFLRYFISQKSDNS